MNFNAATGTSKDVTHILGGQKWPKQLLCPLFTRVYSLIKSVDQILFNIYGCPILLITAVSRQELTWENIGGNSMKEDLSSKTKLDLNLFMLNYLNLDQILTVI